MSNLIPTVRRFSFVSRIWLVIFLMYVSFGNAIGQSFKFQPDPFFKRLNSSTLATVIPSGGSATTYIDALPIVQHTWWPDMQANSNWNTKYKFKSVVDIVRVGINHDTAVIVDNFNYRINLQIKGYRNPASPATAITKNITLYLKYNKDSLQQYNDLSAYKIDDSFHAMQVIVTGIYDSATMQAINRSSLARNFYVESEIMAQRYVLQAESIFINSPPLTTNNMLPVSWRHYDPAVDNFACDYLPPSDDYKPVFYELEWLFLDGYEVSNLQTGQLFHKFSYNGYSLHYDFRNNSTRIQTYKNSYSIPLVYEYGAVIFRIRSVRPDPNNYGQLLYSAWDLPDTGTLQGVNFNNAYACPYHCVTNCLYFMNTAFASDSINYDYKVSFAEDGKYKNVVQYYDGSGNERQSQTKNNSDPDYIVAADKVYDYEGRPAINTLPIPVVAPNLNYKPNLSLNKTTGLPYRASDFDFGCADSIAPFSDTSLASKYYSALNTDQSGLQKFVPDAGGYPFSQTIYSPDNTNKVIWQGGAGSNLQVWKHHAIRNTYVRADQYELDRLMGTESGKSQFYPKVVVTDPNNQATFKIVNPSGKIVASALVGSPPDSSKSPILPLDNIASVQSITTDILASLSQSTSDGIRLAEHNFFAEANGVNTLHYGVSIPPYVPNCGGAYINAKGYYKYNLVSDCGVVATADSGVAGQSNIVTSSASQTFSGPTVSATLNADKYTITKELYFPDTTLQRLASDFTDLHTGINDCYVYRDSFIRRVVETEPFPCQPNDTLDACGLRRQQMIQELYPDAKYGYYSKTPDQTFGPGTNYNSIFSLVDANGHLLVGNPAGAQFMYIMHCYNNYIPPDNVTPPPDSIAYDANCPNHQPTEGTWTGVTIDTIWSNTPPNPCNMGPGCWFTGPYMAQNGGTVYHYRYQAPCLTLPTVIMMDANGNNYTVSASSLSPQDFINHFSESIAEAMLPLHPEYCKLAFCDDNFDKKINYIDNFKEAQILGMSKLSDIISQDPLNSVINPNGPLTPSDLSHFEYDLDPSLNSNGNGNLIRQIDTMSLEQAYCANGSQEAYMYGKNSLYAYQISQMSMPTEQIQDLFFQKLRSNYLANRNYRKQQAMDGVTHCGPCAAYQMQLQPEPVFPQLFDASNNVTFPPATPSWAVQTAQDGVNGNSFNEAPQDLVDYYNNNGGNGTTNCSNQIASIVQSLSPCGMNQTTQQNLSAYLSSNFCGVSGNDGSNITPDNVKQALIAQGITISDLCNPYLATYKLFDQSKLKDRSVYVPKPQSFYDGLSVFLNTTTVKKALATATPSGNVATSLTMDANNPFENELYNYGANGTLNITGYVLTIQQGTAFSYTYPAIVLQSGTYLDTFFFARRQVAATFLNQDCQNPLGDAYPVQLVSAGINDFSFKSVRNTVDEPNFPVDGSQLAYRTVLLSLSGIAGSSTAACDNYAMFSSNLPMLKAADPEALDYCVTCNQIKDGVNSYFQNASTYALPTYINHPLFEASITNYLNYRFNTSYTFDEFESLIKGCAISNQVLANKSRAGYFVEFSGTSMTAPNNFRAALLNQFPDIDLSIFTFIRTVNPEVVLNIDLNSVPKDKLVTVSNFINGYSGVTATYLPPPVFTAELFIKTGSCTPSISIANATIQNETVQIPDINGTLQSYEWYRIISTTSDPTTTANVIQSTMDYVNNPSITCSITPFYNVGLWRSDDYGNPDKQAYLNYVYGLQGVVDDAEISRRLSPSVLQPYSGISDIANAQIVTYKDPWCSNVKEDLYFCKPVSNSGWTMLSNILDRVRSQLSNSLFTTSLSTTLSPGSLGTGGTSLRVYKMSDGGEWYRLFDQQNKLYNVYLYPSVKMAGDPSTYSVSSISSTTLVAVADADSMHRFKVLLSKVINGNTHTVECYGYTDFVIGSGKKLQNVVLFDDQNNKGCLDTFNCERQLLVGAIDQAKIMHAEYIDSIKQSHFLAMKQHFPSSSVDTLLLNTQKLQYQYTLYYYDKVGNLTRSVPPAGVDTLSPSQIALVDANRNANIVGALPNHQKVSQYRYNAMNQLTWQQTPDGGIAEFFYDAAGRLAFSQNARQKPLRKYSYTLYDDQGRISETGVVAFALSSYSIGGPPHPTLVLNSNSTEMADIATQIRAKPREDVIATFYDDPLLSLASNPGMSAQNNTRKRVTSILYAPFLTTNQSSESYYSYGTHFSYDALGNVSTLVQDNPYMDYLGQRFKRVDYDYDLLSSKVNMVSFNRGKNDQYYQRYDYDADNRLLDVFSSKDGLIWDRDAQYSYYKHGPLAEIQIGDLNVQSIQYAYTIQGWLKAINGDILRPDEDMGNDGLNGGFSPPDVFSSTLDYHQGDYKPIGNIPVSYTDGTSPLTKSLYNGNIVRQSVGITSLDNLQKNYKYDQLNRLKSADYMKINNDLSHTVVVMANANAFHNGYTFDPDGNIKTLVRNDNTGAAMDQLSYNYQNSTTNNKLGYVSDASSISGGNDIQQGQALNNYLYDNIGSLVKDVQGNIDTVYWNAYGKVTDIQLNGSGTTIHYDYDGAGNRIRKDLLNLDANGNGMRKSDIYVRDASGNTLAIYKSNTHINGGLTIDYINDDIVNQHGGWITPTNTGIGPFIIWAFGNNGQFTSPLLQTGIDLNPSWANNQSSSLSLGQYLTLSDGIFSLATHESISNYFRPMVDNNVDIAVATFSGADHSAFVPTFTALLTDKNSTLSQNTLIHMTTDAPDLSSRILSDLGLGSPTNPTRDASILYSFIQSHGTGNFMQSYLDNAKGFDPSPFYQSLASDNTIITSTWLNSAPAVVADLTKQVTTYAPRDLASNFFEGYLPTIDKNWLTDKTQLVDRLLVVYNNSQIDYLVSYLDNIGISGLDRVLHTIPQLTINGYLQTVHEAVLVNTLNPSYTPPTVNTPNPQNLSSDTLYLSEHHLYGANRLGVNTYALNSYKVVYSGSSNPVGIQDSTLNKSRPWYSFGFNDWIKTGSANEMSGATYNLSLDTFTNSRFLGSKLYELTDHLGNVLATVLDKKTGYGNTGASYQGYFANLANVTDFFPFGFIMPSRSKTFVGFRYGYNNKENDNDVYGTGNFQDYGMRMYDPRTVRLGWSIDPLTAKYPMLSPYQFANNNPISGIDLDGKEFYYANDGTLIGSIGIDKQVRLVQNDENVKSVALFCVLANESPTLAGYKVDLQSANNLSNAIGMNNDELNLRAFLSTLRTAENFSAGVPTPYNTLYGQKKDGGGTFTDKTYGEAPADYADHPRKFITSWGRKVANSASGAFQITAATFDDIKDKAGVTDFSPTSQEKLAKFMSYQRAKLEIQSGNIVGAASKLKGRWSSLPGGVDEQIDVKQIKATFQNYIKSELHKETILETPQGKL